jgi:hypothetical protein
VTALNKREAMTACRAFFIECSSPYWILSAQHIQREHGWDVAYWTGGERMGPAVANAFPGAVFHSMMAAARGLPAPTLEDMPPAAVDQSLLDAMAPYESLVLKMMDRMDTGGSFLFQERVDFYHRLLCYWEAVLDRLSPQVAVFSSMPHLIYDYLLYLLCRRRGVATLMFDPISIPGTMLTLDSLEQGSRELRQRYQQLLAEGRKSTLSPAVQAYYEGLRQNYSQGMPSHMRGYLERRAMDKAATSWKSRLVKMVHPASIAQSARKASDYLWAPPPANYLKIKGVPLEESWMGGRQWRRYRRERGRVKLELQRRYEKLTSVPDLREPFIFLALHYQPEKTTSPQGGWFVHQELVSDLLIRNLPAGWRLYVKEAVGQFAPYYRHDPSDRARFYQRLVSHPQVKLLPLGIPSFGLIDNCRAVATVTGTVGWEAVARGKPALIFGHAWYRGCEGVYYTPSQEACSAALAEIARGVAVDQEKVRLFFNAAEQVSMVGYVERSGAKANSLTAEENAKALAAALAAHYQKLRQPAASLPSA